MNLHTTVMGLAIGASAASASMATDYSALRADSYVHERLLAASVGHMVEVNCPSISRRTFYALTQMFSLRSYARGLGYSNAELAAYVNSEEEQARFREIAAPYLAAQGVVAGDEESYCAAGRAEIEKGTIAGSLMRSH